MLILRDTTPIPPRALGSVVALGNFDGLHLGHQAVIGETLRRAQQQGRPAMVMTFEPHPRRVFRPDLVTRRIYPFRTKARLLAQMGIEWLRVVRFTRDFSQMPAEHFIHALLLEKLQVSHVVTGEDFRYGHGRAGNADALRESADRQGFGYTRCAPVMLDGLRCSSTHIRAFLAEGNLAQTRRMLARAYTITGRVQSGDKRGRQLGFPTANIVPCMLCTPANGVYAVRARVCGQSVNGVANLGTRPTFNREGIVLEVHLFDWQQAIYGERMEVEFVERLRVEQKFAGIDTLKAQIAKDCDQARRILDSIKPADA